MAREMPEWKCRASIVIRVFRNPIAPTERFALAKSGSAFLVETPTAGRGGTSQTNPVANLGICPVWQVVKVFSIASVNDPKESFHLRSQR
jgi:hypothetical protein